MLLHFMVILPCQKGSILFRMPIQMPHKEGESPMESEGDSIRSTRSS